MAEEYSGMRTASSSFWTGFTSAAALLYKAIGRRLTCVFVDHGLLRKGESDTEPEDAFAHLNKLIPCRENAFLFNKRLSPAGKV